MTACSRLPGSRRLSPPRRRYRRHRLERNGYLDADVGVLQRISRAEIDQILSETLRPSPPRLSVNAFFVHSKGRVALIETGSGDTMGPSLGKLVANMEASGTRPGDIDTVLLDPHASRSLQRALRSDRAGASTPMRNCSSTRRR